MIRVSGGQGFWGDDSSGPVRQIRAGPIDALALDYLAEVTMSILGKQRRRDPKAGYARDFLALMEEVWPDCAEKGIQVVTNAGGVNPMGCAQAVRAAGRRLGIRGAKIGVVTGDDLMDRLEDLISSGHGLRHMETGAPLESVLDRVESANAYFGAGPLIQALDEGALVVICGRAADPALTLAPIAHAFDWPLDSYDLLAAGVVAGHVNECGAQATGGNSLPEWWEIEGLAEVGFPIVEAARDGSFVVAKHPGLGGRVDERTVKEQLVYEIGDPERYATPDVTADFTNLRLAPDGADRIRVQGARGKPPPSKLKVSIGYRAGHAAAGTLVYGWPDAPLKAARAGAILQERLKRKGLQLDETRIEIVGWNATHGALAGPPPLEAGEVELRMAVRSMDRKSVEAFSREVASLILAGPPSVTGYGGGRPKVSDIVAYWPALLAREAVEPHLKVSIIDL